jgi:hypothetical protein
MLGYTFMAYVFYTYSTYISRLHLNLNLGFDALIR